VSTRPHVFARAAWDSWALLGSSGMYPLEI